MKEKTQKLRNCFIRSEIQNLALLNLCFDYFLSGFANHTFMYIIYIYYNYSPDLYVLKTSEICTIQYAFRILLFCKNILYKIKNMQKIRLKKVFYFHYFLYVYIQLYTIFM